MKIFLLNQYDILGGAARAAYRIHQAVRGQGMDSCMMVNNSTSGDWTVRGPKGHVGRFLPVIRHVAGAMTARLLNTQNLVLHSTAVLPSCRVSSINRSEADVVHLHWINHEMLSVEDIGRIKKPLVWTLHDMWAFCGAEHYTDDLRWLDGYTAKNRPSYEKGCDLNRWVWRRKMKAWKRPLHVVTPSKWLGDCARRSKLMHDWPVHVVPNAINTDVWRPVDRVCARKLLGLPLDVPLLLFGAMGGGADPRKGFDLLKNALGALRGQVLGLELVVLGQLAPRDPEEIGFPVHYIGHLHDDLTLSVLYSAVDVMAIPSRQDNLPNTGVEALACGTPVVAFDTCGLPDIVRHQKTGFLAKPFDALDFAKGVEWIISDSERNAWLRQSARADAMERFSYRAVAEKYVNVYETAIASAH